MQTFVPLVNFTRKSFANTARVLDDKRLNKQILEAHQILNILEGRTVRGTYVNHPAVVMWRGYENALKHYHDTMLFAWLARDKKHSYGFYDVPIADVTLPPWMSYVDIEILLSHRVMLYKKDPEHYKDLLHNEFNGNLRTYGITGYIWPTDLFKAYYRIQMSLELDDFGVPDEVVYDEERYTTREDAVRIIEPRLTLYYGHYYVDGNSRFALTNHSNFGASFIRMQPVQYIDYTERKED